MDLIINLRNKIEIALIFSDDSVSAMTENPHVLSGSTLRINCTLNEHYTGDYNISHMYFQFSYKVPHKIILFSMMRYQFRASFDSF